MDELLKNFETDIIMLDTLYQWASNPTSFSAAITRGCSASHNLIKKNIEKRYNLESDKAEEVYNRLKQEIENAGIDFATGYLEWEEYITNIINDKHGDVFREKTLERLNKASRDEKYIVWLYCKVKDIYGLFPHSGHYEDLRDEMYKFAALFNATFNSTMTPTRETIDVLIRIGFINELHWIAARECTRRKDEYIFPKYLESVASEIDKHIPLPDLPDYEKYIDALLEKKVMEALICLDELLHKGYASEIVTIYGSVLPYPYIIGKSGNAVAINFRIYGAFKDTFFERKAKKLKKEKEIDAALNQLVEEYYPLLSLSEIEFELCSASRIWFVDSYDKSLVKSETLIVLTPWLTGKEVKWLRDNYSQKFVMIISTFMGLPEIQKLYKEIYGQLNESGLNWMIIDVSQEKEAYEMIVNVKPKLFEELDAIIKEKTSISKAREGVGKENNNPLIDKLIKNLPEDQLKILKEIWDYFLQNNEWPKGRRFRKERSRLIVDRVVTNLDPIFIWHMNKDKPSEEHYKLTIEGVYAAEGVGGPNIKLILSYLDYLRKKFDENPDFEEITAQEFRDILHINSRDTRTLGELLDMGSHYLWGSSASGLGTSDWRVGVIKDIEILYEANSAQEFLFKQWNDNIEKIITKHPKEVPGIPMPIKVPEPPIEIQESLDRFQLDYPNPTKVAFIMMQFRKTKAHAEIVKEIRSALDSHGIRGIKADDKQYHDILFYNIMTYLYGCGFGIAVFERIEAEEFNPNVSFEVGYMSALKKPVCLLKDETLKTLPTDLVGQLYKEFNTQDPGKSIPSEISRWLSDKGILKTKS